MPYPHANDRMSNVLPALAGMLAILTMASLGAFAVAVLAPQAGVSLGVSNSG